LAAVVLIVLLDDPEPTVGHREQDIVGLTAEQQAESAELFEPDQLGRLCLRTPGVPRSRTVSRRRLRY
jgi:hypothetical protein